MLPFNQGLITGTILGMGTMFVGIFIFVGLEYLIWRQKQQTGAQVLDPSKKHMRGQSWGSERHSKKV